ncbi:MAG: hypothetical protein MHM6MM_003554 [Cercozoa sp. M6MM]
MKQLVVVGTYENLLYGVDVTVRGMAARVKQRFVSQASESAVRTVSVAEGGDLLAVGGTDETVSLFSLRRSVSLGSLQRHRGSINALAFFGRTHLLSGSEDGDVCVWRTSTWECLRTLRAHGHRHAKNGRLNGVQHVSVHPSGRLCATVGRSDSTLKLWDLTTGTCALTQRLPSDCSHVLWLPSGRGFVLLLRQRPKLGEQAEEQAGERQLAGNGNGSVLLVCDLAGQVLVSSELPPVLSAAFMPQCDILVLGTADGRVSWRNAANGDVLASYKAHDARVVAVNTSARTDLDDHALIYSVDSAGDLLVWDMPCHADLIANAESCEVLASHSFKCRVTSLACVPPEQKQPVAEKRVRSESAETSTQPKKQQRSAKKQNDDSKQQKQQQKEQVAQPAKKKRRVRNKKSTGFQVVSAQKTAEHSGVLSGVAGVSTAPKAPAAPSAVAPGGGAAKHANHNTNRPRPRKRRNKKKSNAKKAKSSRSQ